MYAALGTIRSVALLPPSCLMGEIMKKFAFVVGLTTVLAACSAPAEEAATDTASTEEAAMVAETTAADGGPSTGTFTVTNAAGEVSTEVISADGTYTSTEADGTVSTGMWEQRSPNEFCTQPSDQEVMKCYAESLNEDGVWNSVDPDDGEVSVIERVADEAAATEG